MAGDHERILSAHLVDWLAEVGLAHLLQLSAVHEPVFDHGVPAGGDEQALTVQVKRVNVLDRRIMSTDRQGLHACLVGVPDFDGVVSMRDEDPGRRGG